jgi:superfamily II DNA or RNA helicase
MTDFKVSDKFRNSFKKKILKFKKKRNRLPKLETLIDTDDDLYTEDDEYIELCLKPLYSSIINELTSLPNIKIEDLKLRDYQESIITKVLHNLENDNTRTMMIAPTGAGKTKMAFVTMSRMIINKPMLYVFVSPLLRINKQCLKDTNILINSDFNKSNNLDVFKEIEINSTNTKYEKEYHSALENNKNIILSTTYKSLSKVFKLLDNTNIHIDLLLLDECHMIPSYVHNKTYFDSLHNASSDTQDTETNEDNYGMNNDEYQETIKQSNMNIKKTDYYNLFFSDKVNKRLFITATPYDYQKENTEMYGEYIEEIKVGELIKKGYLANVETFLSKTTLINEDIMGLPDIATSILKFATTENRLRLCVFVNTKSNGEILKQKLLDSNLYKSFNESNGSLKIIEPILYMGKDDISKLNKFDDGKTEFNKNEIRIIISCKKLSMGVDIPCIDSIIFADPRMNKADISQCVGRGLRLFKIGDEIKVCKILLLDYPRKEKNDMICAYLDYLKNCDIVFNITAKISKGIPEKPKPEYDCKCENNSNDCCNCNLVFKKFDIYDGNLNVDIEYYEEYSTFNKDKINDNETLYNYQIAKEEYNAIKTLCNKHNITNIDEYLKLIGTIKYDKIHKLTNPEVYFSNIKIPKNYSKIWICWYDLFNINYSTMPKTLTEFKSKIEDLELDSMSKYFNYCNKNKDLPYNPKFLYNNCKDLDLILNEIFD